MKNSFRTSNAILITAFLFVCCPYYASADFDPNSKIAGLPPYNLFAYGATNTEIDLSWTDRTGGLGTTVVQRSTDANHWSTVATVAAGTTSYKNIGLAKNFGAFYRVYTVVSGSNSAFSSYTYGQVAPYTTQMQPPNYLWLSNQSGMQDPGVAMVPSSGCQPTLITAHFSGTMLTAPPVADINLGLTTTGHGSFYTNSKCTVLVANPKIAKGTYSLLLYYKNAATEMTTVTATDLAGGLTTGNLSLEVSPPVTLNTAFGCAPGPGIAKTIPKGQCLQLQTVSQNTFGDAVWTPNDIAISLSASKGTVYSDFQCKTSLSSTQISAGQPTSPNFWFSDSLEEDVNLSANDTSGTLSSGGILIQVGSPTAVQLSPVDGSQVSVGVCTPVTMSSIDSGGRVIGTNSSHQFYGNLSTTGTGVFYYDANCTTPMYLNTSTVPPSYSAGFSTCHATNTFYFLDTAAETVTLTLWDSNVTPLQPAQVTYNVVP